MGKTVTYINTHILTHINTHTHTHTHTRTHTHTCSLVHEDKRTILIGIYIPPSDVTLESTSHLDDAPRNESAENTVVLRDFNVNFDNPKDDRQSEIVDAILTYDFRNLAKQFKCKRNKPFTWTWRQFKQYAITSSLEDVSAGKISM